MKAIMCYRYGPPETLKLDEVQKPTPQGNQVLVKVNASSANTADLTFRGGAARLFSGLSKPKDPRVGIDLAGQVEAVGPEVTQFHPGDLVFGGGVGTFAEYALARDIRLAPKPAGVSFEAAATIPVAAVTALQGLRDKGQIKAGEKVLIYGASGSVGSFAPQVAKSFGAEVTAVVSPRNLEAAASMGADHVIDYTREDFTRSGQQYDLILAVNGYHPIFDYRRALSPTGRFVLAGAEGRHVFLAILQAMILGPILSKKDGPKFIFMGIASITQQDLITLGNLVETGKIVPLIEKRYPLSETPQALGYLLTGHARAKNVIIVDQEH